LMIYASFYTVDQKLQLKDSCKTKNLDSVSSPGTSLA